jgi:hypothetical protein
MALGACSSGNVPIAAPTSRVATQTPWVIYVPITSTPEPATVTPLPSITAAVKVAARTATRAPAAATKPPVAVATKAATAPGPAVPPPTAAPACSASAVTLLFPENGVPRGTRKDGTGGSSFDLKWTPYQSAPGDPQMGYQISLSSKRTGFSNGATVYVSHSRYLQDGQHYIFDQRSVSSLASGESVTVSWYVTVVKTTGSFDNQGGISGSVVNCSPPSQIFTIQLVVQE